MITDCDFNIIVIIIGQQNQNLIMLLLYILGPSKVQVSVTPSTLPAGQAENQPKENAILIRMQLQPPMYRLTVFLSNFSYKRHKKNLHKP